MFAKSLILKSLFLLSIANSFGMEPKEVPVRNQEITEQQAKLFIPVDIQNILIQFCILESDQNEIIPSLKNLRRVCRFWKDKIDSDEFTQFVLDHLEQTKRKLLESKIQDLKYIPLKLKLKKLNATTIFQKGYLKPRIEIMNDFIKGIEIKHPELELYKNAWISNLENYLKQKDKMQWDIFVDAFSATNKITPALFLLDYGIDPNSQTKMHFEMPLHLAILHDASPRIIEMLLDFGARTDTYDARNTTPVTKVKFYDRKKLMHLILNHKNP